MRGLLVPLVAASLLAGGLPAAAGPVEVRDGDAYALLDAGEVRIGNALVERVVRWEGGGLRTASVRDKRTGREWVGPGGSNAFTLSRGPVTITSAGWTVASQAATPMPGGGVAVRLRLRNPAWPGLEVIRRMEVLPQVAGFATRTTLRSALPLELDAYTAEELTLAGTGLRAHGVDMRGGADWRDESGYDYRADLRPGPSGQVAGTGEWLDVTAEGGEGIAMLLVRRNYHSSVVRFDGARASVGVETTRDLQYLGPIPPGTAGPNPTGVARYTRKVLAGGSLELEPAFLALGTDPDDLPWQAYRWLRSQMRWTAGGVATVDFNTDKVDAGVRGPGAKDDADMQTLLQLLPILQRLGVEVLVLDDGWMPYNGDWEPDPDRYPDGFEPLVAELDRRGMRLGLWMAPGSFHPSSRAFRENPEWSCAPVGTATGVANLADPEGRTVTGSAEPGIGVWNMAGRNRAGEAFADWLRASIERLVTRYGVVKFKFDFLVWLDCASPDPVDVYQYHDAFFGRVIDPLAAAHPAVGFGLDETNDFRGFPYESILRGPTWFQNGTPPPDVLLHNVWTLAPYVPGFALGMHVLGGSSPLQYPVDYLVAVSMLYQPTIWTDVRRLQGAVDPLGQPVIETARAWFDFFKARRAELAGFTYPLLGDPLGGKGWAAFQPWDRDAQRGFVLAFRQDTAQESASVPLRGVDPWRRYAITDEVDGSPVAELSGAELAAGQLQVTVGRRFGFRVLRVEPLA